MFSKSIPFTTQHFLYLKCLTLTIYIILCLIGLDGVKNQISSDLYLVSVIMQSQITSSLTVNVTMETISSVYKDPSLELTYRILVPAILAVIMFIVGCDITWDSMKAHLRRPLGPLIGALCQFGLLPLAAFGLSLMLNLPKEQALGVVIVSSCPGGAVSNIFTYWTDGDLSLR